MNLSIRTRLTLLIALVFLVVFVIVLTAGAGAFYVGVTRDIDTVLQTETVRARALFESKYAYLTAAEDPDDNPVDEFVEDLEELFEGTRRFSVFIVASGDIDEVCQAGDGAEDYEAFLNQAPSEGDDRFYHFIGDRLYRIQISRHAWGTLLMGAESPILPDVAGQLVNILLVVVPVTLVLILVGGRFLARRGMAPVLSAARAAERITVNNLSERLPAYPAEDEFGTLLSTFNRMIERVETGVRRIQRFTQDAAHELRSPLAILRGELELSYQHDHVPDEVRDSLQKSLDRTIAMHEMVENLMLLARSDAGRFTLEKEQMALDEIVADVVEDIKILAENRPVTVSVARCDPVALTGDEALIRRLLLNLLDNALKYTASGSITVSLTTHTGQIECAISDTGIGIPEANLPHLFDRFYRVDESRNRDSGGSGLGLAICKWIANVHGGDIRVESTIGKGTTVVLTLPISS